MQVCADERKGALVQIGIGSFFRRVRSSWRGHASSTEMRGVAAPHVDFSYGSCTSTRVGRTDRCSQGASAHPDEVSKGRLTAEAANLATERLYPVLQFANLSLGSFQFIA